MSNMRRCRCLIFNLLLILAYNAALSANSSLENDWEPRLATLEARRAAREILFAERAGLQAGDHVGFVQLTNRIAELDLQLNEMDAALSEVTESLKRAKELDPAAFGTLLTDTYILHGLVLTNRGDYKSAPTFLNQGLELSGNLKYLRGEAKANYYLAINHQVQFKIKEAKDAINESIKIWQQLGDKRGEGLALRSKGEIYTIGDLPDEAIAAYQNALVIWLELNDPVERATTLIDLNFTAIRQGQWAQALALLNEVQALAIDKEAEPYTAGQIAMSLGEVYEAYHQLPTALNYFKESLYHYKNVAHKVSAAVDARNKVGRVLAQLGHSDEAKQTIEEGLRISEQHGMPLLSGLGHEDLGRVYLTRQQYAEARLEFLTALTYFTEGSRAWARTQSYLGQTEYLMGNLPAADSAYQEALQTFVKLSDYTNEAALRFGIGKLAFDRDQLDLAESSLQRSIELTEHLRDNAASMDLRSSFLGSVHDRYETQVELLMAVNAKHPDRRLDVRAFEVSENGRARSLLDSLRTYRRDLREISDLSLLRKEEELQKAELKLIDAKAEALSRGKTHEATAQIDKQLMEVRAKQETLQARINTNSRYRNFVQPVPLSLQSIQNEVIDDKTSLVEFALGTRQSFAWVVTKNGFSTTHLESKQTIAAAAQKLIKLLGGGPGDADYDGKLQTAIEEVSKMVVLPLAEKLKTERLIIVADGILQYVPFHVLSTSAKWNEPLIDRFEIANAASASTLALMRQQRKNRQPGSKLVVGFGDAVFSSSSSQETTSDAANSTVARSAAVVQESRLPPLFKSQAELRAIRDLAGTNDSEFYLQYDATRQNLLNIDLSNFKILHLVTHGLFDERQPELSGLVLSLRDANQQHVNGYVGLADIYKLNAPVDLVVLSACNSALGPEVRGEGLTGLTRGFTYAGASSIVASFWNVDDEAGTELMKQFYTNLLQHNMSPAAALRAAQNEIRKRPEWRSPYFWAGFTFQGDFDQRITANTTKPRNQILIATAVFVVLVTGAVYWFIRRRRRHQR